MYYAKLRLWYAELVKYLTRTVTKQKQSSYFNHVSLNCQKTQKSEMHCTCYIR